MYLYNYVNTQKNVLLKSTYIKNALYTRSILQTEIVTGEIFGQM